MKSLDSILKKEASAGIRKSGISRYELAAKMSEMLGYEISKSMIDNRTSKFKKDQLWPASWVVSFALITGYYGQIKAINRLAKFPAAGSEESLDREIDLKRRMFEKGQKELDDLMRLKHYIKNGKERR